MDKLEDIKKDIEEIKIRNNRVEGDKAWEVSWVRRILVSVLTYIVALAWLKMINEQNYELKAIVPVAGYILSTFSLSVVKKWWFKSR